MSAYVVDHPTIARILDFIARDASRGVGRTRRRIAPGIFTGFDLTNPVGLETLGDELLAMNQDAVMQRYPDDPVTELPGPNKPGVFSYSRGMPPSLVQAHKSITCLVYQCSEGDVVGRPLYHQLVEYGHELAEAYLMGLSEWDSAKWG